VTPDHLTVIASNRAEGYHPLNGTKEGDKDLFAIFDISADSTLVEGSKQLVQSGGRAPRHFTLSSEGIKLQDEQGKWLAVAHHDSDEIVIFELGKGGALKGVARL
jgi:6-phosphogluconolactonase